MHFENNVEYVEFKDLYTWLDWSESNIYEKVEKTIRIEACRDFTSFYFYLNSHM